MSRLSILRLLPVLVPLMALGACAVPAAQAPNQTSAQVSPEGSQEDLSAATTQAAEAAMRSGDPRQAVNIYQRGYERRPSAVLATHVGRAMRMAGDPQSGLVFLADADHKFPSNVDLLTEMGRCGLAGGYIPEAGEALAKAAALPGAKWGTWTTWAVYAARTGDLAAAEQRLLKAVVKADTNHETIATMSNLSLIMAAKGDINGAITSLEELLKRPGVEPQVHRNLVALYALKGDKAHFVEAARRAALTASDVDAGAAWIDATH